MKKRQCFMTILFLSVLLLLIAEGDLGSQVWWEESGEAHDYDLSRYHILILLGDDFDYHETVIIGDKWREWGAEVDIAGVAKKLKGHLWKKTEKGWDRSEEKQIETDLLIEQVDLSKYDAIFLPGGNSPTDLLEREGERVVRLIQDANGKRKVIAAICHGPQVLAAADVVRGRKVTGYPEVIEALAEAGGNVVNEVCVVDGNLITGNWPYFETMALEVAERLLYPEGGGPSERSPFATNPVLNVIRDRRSIRSYLEREVDDDSLKLLLKAATWAPSANNDQPWKFVYVRNREIKTKICESLLEKMRPYYEKHEVPLERVEAYWRRVFSAPVHVFAFSDPRSIEMDEEWKELEMLHCVQGVSVACQNILLAATSIGLGSLWIGGALAVEEEIKALLEVPEGVRLIAVIAIGHAAGERLPPVRKSLADVVFSERWVEK